MYGNVWAAPFPGTPCDHKAEANNVHTAVLDKEGRKVSISACTPPTGQNPQHRHDAVRHSHQWALRSTARHPQELSMSSITSGMETHSSAGEVGEEGSASAGSTASQTAHALNSAAWTVILPVCSSSWA
jgi:hypothetical protein